MKRSLHVFGIVLSLLVYVPLSGGLGLAETLVVNDDGRDCPRALYSSIQDAADIAQSGDTILVFTGTYAGATVEKPLHFRAKGKVVINDGPNSHSFLRAGFLFPAGGGGSGSSIHGFRFEGRPQFGYSDDGYLDFPIFSRGADKVVVERKVRLQSRMRKKGTYFPILCCQENRSDLFC